MAVFALGNGFIGLHCALGEFSDMLPHARDVARCISACPGLARVSKPHLSRFWQTMEQQEVEREGNATQTTAILY